MRLNDWHDAFTDLMAGNSQPLASTVQGTHSFPVNERLNVYRNNYRQGVIGHLRQTFERCNAHVGEDYFAQLASSYLAEYPPQTTALEGYGYEFPKHLATLQTQRSELAKLAYLPDLAKLDWLCDEIYYSPAPSPWPRQVFNELTLEQQANTQLLLSPACRLLRSHWPLSQLWELHAERCDDVEMQYLEQAEHLLLYRQNYRIRLKKLPDDIYLLLQAVQEGNALHLLAERFPNSIGHLPELTSKGWIHDFKTKDHHA